jgi:uncharacterized membrane protein
MGEIVFLVVLASVLGAFGYPLIVAYDWYLFLHIFGVVLFVGNIIVTGAWMYLAERTRETAVLRFASRVVNWADVAFTAPGIILIVIGGLTISSNRWGGPLATGWLMAGATLFLASGVVWIAFLIRYQDKMIKLTEGSGGGAELPKEFFSTLHRWYFWGAVATILPIAASIFMVVKLSI